ncbi:hypothetical protein ACVWZ6_003568 [Bradyrhizobium sp. GM6.1]
MLATAVGIDRTIEADVGRFVAGDHLARGVDPDRGLERGQFFKALPAIVECDARLGLKPAAGVGLRAPASPALAVDGDRQLREVRRRTRRLGGRRDRRVLESMRGCWTHEAKIACQRNKSRTQTKNVKTTPCTVELPKFRAGVFDFTQHQRDHDSV